MTEIEKLTEQIKTLETKRSELIRAKTVTYGELIDAITEMNSKCMYSENYFSIRLEAALHKIREIKGE